MRTSPCHQQRDARKTISESAPVKAKTAQQLTERRIKKERDD